MAKSRGNEVMQGASGRIGRNLVFRQRGDKTIIARRAQINADARPVSAKQQRVKDNFLDATLYAKKALKDEDVKAAYKSKAGMNQSAYNVALKDFLTPPQVRRLDDSAYTGNIGDKISFLVKDVMRVTEISFAIIGPDDTIVEEGPAVPLDDEGVQWEYETTAELAGFEQATYQITMLDTPKKTTVVAKAYAEDIMPD